MSKIKKTSTNFANKQALNEECPEVYAGNILGGQWSLVIVSWLMSSGRLRFSELKNLLPNITERMLTLQLKKLVDDRLVKRTVYAEVPPRTEYELTEIGYDLKPVITQLDAWGRKHKELIDSELAINN